MACPGARRSSNIGGPRTTRPSKLEWIKANVPILKVARKLSLDVVDNSARCWRRANHKNGDRHPSLGLDVARNRYKCFVCDKKSASVVDLVMAVRRISLPEALKWFTSHFAAPDFGGQRHPDLDTTHVSLTTLIRSGVWATLSNSERSIVAVLWDARDPNGLVALSYSRILRLCGLGSSDTLTRALRRFEGIKLLAIERSPRRMSTYRFLEHSDFCEHHTNSRYCAPTVAVGGSPGNELLSTPSLQ
jgi:hypothetical protein